MREIGDDPIVRCMERFGYPPWLVWGGKNFEEREAGPARGEDDDGKL